MLERWACKNLMKFHKAKCKVLHLDQGNPKHGYSLGSKGIEISPMEKDFCLLVDEKPDDSPQGVLAAQKASCILGCIKRNSKQVEGGVCKKSGDGLLTRIWSDITRGDGFKLKESQFRVVIMKKFFALREVRDPAICPIESDIFGLVPSIQPVQILLQSLPELQQINSPTQLGIILRFTEDALNPLIQIINKDIKQD
ncbi:hypothetical protein BTVI_63576 [Pitangus sulphuratus]|nr:hypothetical protein BTVI_63576 [Pitangus sulphuratus]